MYDNFSFLTENDNEIEIVIALSKIRAIVLLERSPGIYNYKVADGKQTLLAYMINICCQKSQYVKLYSFRVKIFLFF